MLSVLLLLGGLAPALPAAGLWCPPGPHGQQHWHEGHPECGGRAQSPIDIATAWAQPDLSLPPLQPEGYEHPESPRLSLANNGHTAVLALPPSLRLRGLPHTFTAVQLHFHWGRPGHAAGAEHLLDGHRAPAEMHVVHFDAERFADASAAQQHPGGLAVLGVLLEVGDDPHPAYDNILKHLGSIRYAGQTVAIPSFSIRDLLPAHLDRYYRYNGSLTTPPCFQSVLWTVFPQPVRISRAQLEQLQGSLYSTEEAEPDEPQLLVDNFRAPQELNQRLVLSSFPREPEGYSTGRARPGGWAGGSPLHPPEPPGVTQVRSSPSSLAPSPAASASSSPSTLGPSGCAPGGHRRRTSCSRLPPAAPPWPLDTPADPQAGLGGAHTALPPLLIKPFPPPRGSLWGGNGGL
ncbi:carbonic anhydrase 14 isoform X3 [Poecile atricapillus]|uniref:carbonic anhydrase 14 isoform X3 n=1 Tax=Poecile atricapillus TaxID=48891 RepID=UPI00273A4F72|nr:carbonic anhydrase 14 isoform X3 [Poecile atricapillus]